jgi:cell division septum initiation protein DivIVA
MAKNRSGSEIEALIEEIYNVIDRGASLPFSSKIAIDKQNLLVLCDRLSAALPADIVQSKQIVRERDNILGKAEDEAFAIIKNAEEQQRRLVSRDVIVEEAKIKAAEVTQRTQALAADIIARANAEAEQILNNANSYVNKAMSKTLEIMRVYMDGAEKIRSAVSIPLNRALPTEDDSNDM